MNDEIIHSGLSEGGVIQYKAVYRDRSAPQTFQELQGGRAPKTSRRYSEDGLKRRRKSNG